MDAQVGHADVVGIGVDEGEGDSASPVFNDGAGLAGEADFGIVKFMLAH